MRFIITSIVIMGLVMMTMMGQNNESVTNWNAPDLSFEYLENPDTRHSLKKILNKIVIFILAGWAFGRLFMQFRRIIVFFLGLFIIFNFVLMLSGVVSLKIQWDDMEPIFQAVKMMLINIGFLSFMSILIGLWIGVKGYSS